MVNPHNVRLQTKGMDVGNIHVQKKEMEDQRNHGQILGASTVKGPAEEQEP